MMRYITLQPRKSIQIKLFQSCKQLRNYIRRKRDYEVDKLIFSDAYSEEHSLSLSGNEVVYKTYLPNKYLCKPKPIKVTALHIVYAWYPTINMQLSPQIDLSNLEELLLFWISILEEAFKLILLPTLKRLTIRCTCSDEFADIPFTCFALENTSNLQFLW